MGDGSSALHLAAVNKRLDCCVVLARAGAQLEDCLISMGEDAYNTMAYSLLAALFGQSFNSGAYQKALQALPDDQAWGEGELYEVHFPSVRLRHEPSLRAECVGQSKRLKGEKVSILEHCYNEDGHGGRMDVRTHEGRQTAYILIQQSDMENLLGPVNSKFEASVFG